MDMKFDLAEVLEKTRKMKRKLCEPPFSLDTDLVFAGQFLDADHMEALRHRVQGLFKDVVGVGQCLKEMDYIIEGLKAGPERPSDHELCRRYVDNEVEARTVGHITGWSPVELYNKCLEHGYQAPAFGD
jgi:hypothetical protein